MGKFNLNAACPASTKCKRAIQKACDIKVGSSWCAPPSIVAAKLGHGRAWLVGVDLETNDWVTTRDIKGTFGQFGHIGANGTTTPASQQKAYEYVCYLQVGGGSHLIL